ncbi:UPF0175 family protein [Haloterrigena alkaliphila]|uniref:UPF0175 family protein n=1 Tax=Haloterrigena alkaliphila TaxID=2816475 RepID=A0A8A2VND5_9EURY|nr:UPF0175 family protein [Haloterrigena alkaliphila]QSW99638.1 UPF0175 family protein [Haloterrigena alkaliphila]
MPSISARVSDEDAEELESVAELIGDDKSTVVRRALRKGLSDIRIQFAVDRYQTGDVSVNQAAQIAGVNLAEWLQIARERNLTSQLSPEDLDADASTAREL